MTGTPRCPAGGRYPTRPVTLERLSPPDRALLEKPMAECPACGRRVAVSSSGRMRHHSITSSWQPALEMS